MNYLFSRGKETTLVKGIRSRESARGAECKWDGKWQRRKIRAKALNQRAGEKKTEEKPRWREKILKEMMHAAGKVR